MGDGGTCILYCMSTTSAIFCKLQGQDSDPERHPFCFCSSLHDIHRQSQTGACFRDLWSQLPKGGHGMSSHTSVGHTNFYTQELEYLLVAFLVLQGYDHLHNWWGSGGNTRLYSFGDANAYDLYEPIWILPKIQAGFEGGREIVCCICWG